MYKIETELGVFEGETEKDAKKLLRAAKRKADKRAEIDRADGEMARLKSAAAGFKHLTNLREDRRAPHSCIVRKGEDEFPVVRDENNDRQFWTTIEPYTKNGDETRLETYAYEPVAALWNVNGVVELIWTRDIDRPDDPLTCLAVAVHGRQVGWQYMPAELTPEWLEAEDVESGVTA